MINHNLYNKSKNYIGNLYLININYYMYNYIKNDIVIIVIIYYTYCISILKLI